MLCKIRAKAGKFLLHDIGGRAHADALVHATVKKRCRRRQPLIVDEHVFGPVGVDCARDGCAQKLHIQDFGFRLGVGRTHDLPRLQAERACDLFDLFDAWPLVLLVAIAQHVPDRALRHAAFGRQRVLRPVACGHQSRDVIT